VSAAGKQRRRRYALTLKLRYASRTTGPCARCPAECAERDEASSIATARNRRRVFKHAWKKRANSSDRFAGTGQIDNRRGSKEQTKHRTEPVKRDVDLCVLIASNARASNLRARLVEQFQPSILRVRATAQTAAIAMDSRQGSCLIHGPSGESWSMIRSRPPNAPTGCPPPIIFPTQSDQVSLRKLPVRRRANTEASDDLVKNQKRIVYSCILRAGSTEYFRSQIETRVGWIG